MFLYGHLTAILLLTISITAHEADEVELIMKAFCSEDQKLIDTRNKECFTGVDDTVMSAEKDCQEEATKKYPSFQALCAEVQIHGSPVAAKLHDCVENKQKNMTKANAEKLVELHDCLVKIVKDFKPEQ